MTDDNPMDAERLIAAFGGIRPMAKKIGVAVTTVQGWKERGNIPMAHLPKIRAAAAEEGIDLDNLPPAQKEESAESEAPPTARAGSPASQAGARSRVESVAAEKVEAESETGKIKDAGSAETVIEGEAGEKGSDAGRRGLMRPALLAGAFGLTLAIGVLAGWQIGLLEQPPAKADTAAFEEQLEAAGAAASRNEAAISDLRDRLAAAETAAGEAGEKAASLESRVGALAESVDGLGTLREEVAGLRQTVEELSTRMTALAATGEADPQAAEALARLVERTDALGEKLEGFDGRLGELDARIEALAAEAGGQQQGADGEEIAQRIDAALAETRKALEGEIATLGERTAALSQRLDTVAAAQERMRQGATGEAAVILALGQLQTAVVEGRSYGDLLDHLARLTAGREGFAEPVAALRPMAETGVVSREALRLAFEPAGVEIVRAGLEGKEGDWAERSLARLRSLIVIRRTGADVEGESPAAIVSRAEAALAVGEVDKAVAELSALQGPAQAAAADWIGKAKAHLAAQRALAELNRLALGASETGGEGSGNE
jgi:predicted  nucleic acid-binding Zn-ribbon protein